MLSTTIKRSVALLGAVAGLLAAAGPASAGPAGASAQVRNDYLAGLKAGASEVLYETVTVKAPRPSDAHLEGAWPQEVEISGLMETNGDQLFMKAPTNAGPQVGSEGVKGNALIDYEGTTFDVKANAVLLGEGLVGDGGF